ncbi:hypothetical protein AVEN_40922-1, partial [Araneus ventricosus]
MIFDPSVGQIAIASKPTDGSILSDLVRMKNHPEPVLIRKPHP